MMRKNNLMLFLVLLFSTLAKAQTAAVYPSNWWAGMKHNKLQLIIRADDGFIIPDKSTINWKHEGIKIEKIIRPTNKQYLLLDITIAANAKIGKSIIKIAGIKKDDQYNIPFEIKKRRAGNGTLYAQGLSSKDLIYLIMPDRFCNGDESNDKVPGMLDQTLRRDTVFNRHGGDLAGIQSKLDYLKNLGVTALWLNPIIENDMPNRTEHGYSFTNHYKVDRRLGGEVAYHNLIDAAHKKGIKIIQDAVYNHVGDQHIFFKSLPDSNWFHWFPTFTQTNYKDQTLFDPYASKIDKTTMTDGWFVQVMPDWNHKNLFVEKFLIQHAIWTVEEFGIDAWRIDTYAYNDLEFMNRCNAALLKEFPKLFMFGETWVHGVPNQSYFTLNNYNIPYKSNLQSVTDFQALWGIKDVVTKDFGWTDGVNKLYTTIAQDFVYQRPNDLVIFLDNHDINRFFSECGKDVNKYKMSLAWLLTTRGIPQLYYGDEIATEGFTNPNDGYVRLDFPGGWKGDAYNKFEASGRNQVEDEVFNYVKKLANYRKTSAAITEGNLKQYLPINGVYVYFRTKGKQTVMTIMHTGKEKQTLQLARFAESMAGKRIMKNIITDESAAIGTTLDVLPGTTLVLELN